MILVKLLKVEIYTDYYYCSFLIKYFHREITIKNIDN